jgi:hypothetical protein
VAHTVTFAYSWRWATLEQAPLPADTGEARDRELEQYLASPGQQYDLTIALSDGSIATFLGATTAYWERQRGQFVTLRCDAFATATGPAAGRSLVLPLPSTSRPARLTVGASTVPFPAAGLAVVSNASGIVTTHLPYFDTVGALGLAVKFSSLSDTFTAGNTVSMAVTYRETL